MLGVFVSLVLLTDFQVPLHKRRHSSRRLACFSPPARSFAAGGEQAINNRHTILSAQFPPGTSTEPFLELDLRDIYTNVRLGRRGQLQVMTKLVFGPRSSSPAPRKPCPGA
jgi:hypothetical protein